MPKKWVNIASAFLKYFFIFPFSRLKNTGKSANINNGEKMDISAEKLWLIENLLKIQDEVLLHRIKAFIENLLGKKPAVDLEPMSLKTFYSRIEDSEAALERGDIITQNELREEIKTWKKT